MIVDMLSGQKVSSNRIFTKHEVDKLVMSVLEMYSLETDSDEEVTKFLDWLKQRIQDMPTLEN